MSDAHINPIVEEVEITDAEKAGKRGYRNGFSNGLQVGMECLLTLPYECLTTEFVEKYLDLEVRKTGWYSGIFRAIEGEYTNKKGKSHTAWFSQNNKYLKRKKEGETEHFYRGYGKWSDDLVVVFNREKYELFQKYKTMGAFVEKKTKTFKVKKTKKIKRKTNLQLVD